MAKSKSNEPVVVFRSSFLALIMARLISSRRADVPGKGRDSKLVPERNLYRMLEDMAILTTYYYYCTKNSSVVIIYTVAIRYSVGID